VLTFYSLLPSLLTHFGSSSRILPRKLRKKRLRIEKAENSPNKLVFQGQQTPVARLLLSPKMADRKQELSQLTVENLRKLLKQKGLSPSGNKNTLVKRLVAFETISNSKETDKETLDNNIEANPSQTSSDSTTNIAQHDAQTTKAEPVSQEDEYLKRKLRILQGDIESLSLVIEELSQNSTNKVKVEMRLQRLNECRVSCLEVVVKSGSERKLKKWFKEINIIIKMEKQTVKELKALAKEQGIKGYYKLRKAELIEALTNAKPPRNIVPKTSSRILDEPKRDPTKCLHGKVKYYCRDCRGSQICPHDRRKSRCRECNGGSFCEHKRARYICKDCNGKGICEHNRQKFFCKLCGGSQICEHNRQKSQCKACHATQETRQD